MERAHVLECVPPADIDFVRGENCWLWDAQGRRFTDLESGSWSTALGHCHPRITRCLADQAGRVIHLNVRHPGSLAEEAAAALCRLAGLPDGRAVFLSSGSEAVEFAVQAALGLTRRGGLLGFGPGYHAAYGLAGNLKASDWSLVDWMGGAGRDCLDRVDFARIGALLLETGGASPSFVRFPPDGLVREMVRRTREAGGLVVANEITTGLGRTGAWFGFQHYGIQPDIVAVGKGLGNGYPVSAAVLSAEAAERYAAAGLRHAQSHQNNPLGCAVAREVLAELEEGGWIARAAVMGNRILEGLAALPDPHKRIRECRGRGMLLAIEFEPGCGLDGETAHARLWERGYVTACYPANHPAGTGLRLDPALTLPEAEMEGFLACLGELLAR